ncbi:hypothetical protein ACJX0J_036246, partial [Zea mays]
LVMVQRQMGHHHISRSYFRQTDIKRSGNASIDIMSKFFKLMVVLQLMNDLNEVFKMPLSLVLRLVNSIFDIVCGLPVRFFPSISCDLSVRRLIVCLRFFDLSIIPLRYWNKRVPMLYCSLPPRLPQCRQVSPLQQILDDVLIYFWFCRIIASLRANQFCERLPSPNGESTVDCHQISKMPNLAFTIANKTFTLTPEQYIVKLEQAGQTICINGASPCPRSPPPRPRLSASAPFVSPQWPRPYLMSTTTT